MYKALPWSPPLDFAQTLYASQQPFVCLYSSLKNTYSGRYSYIACSPSSLIDTDDLSQFQPDSQATDPFENSWFGYLGYENLHALETIPSSSDAPLHLPRVWMMQPTLVFIFDHDTTSLKVWYSHDAALATLPSPTSPPTTPTPSVTHVSSTMSKSDYLSAVQHTIDRIHEGDFFQANITRKFMGSFDSAPQCLAIFRDLCDHSPAPYSSFIYTGTTSILSSSPEQFLTIQANGHTSSRPIKGTAPRGDHDQADDRLLNALMASQKDQSENLMIVDLMRNDLSRSCEPGSVKVTEQFSVAPFSTLFHLYSTIEGQKRPDVSSLSLVKAAFPPGSMTGAPKVKAMEHCARHEAVNRGVYSGTIGYFGGDGSTDLSVVIRTLIIRDHQFEFQVGGGIVAESDPETEWKETLIKSKGIGLALQFDPFETLAF